MEPGREEIGRRRERGLDDNCLLPIYPVFWEQCGSTPIQTHAADAPHARLQERNQGEENGRRRCDRDKRDSELFKPAS